MNLLELNLGPFLRPFSGIKTGNNEEITDQSSRYPIYLALKVAQIVTMASIFVTLGMFALFPGAYMAFGHFATTMGLSSAFLYTLFTASMFCLSISCRIAHETLIKKDPLIGKNFTNMLFKRL